MTDYQAMSRAKRTSDRITFLLSLCLIFSIISACASGYLALRLYRFDAKLQQVQAQFDE